MLYLLLVKLLCDCLTSAVPPLHAQVPAYHPHHEQTRWEKKRELIKIFIQGIFVKDLSQTPCLDFLLPKEWPLREEASTSLRRYSQQLLLIRTSRCENYSSLKLRFGNGNKVFFDLKTRSFNLFNLHLHHISKS